MDLRNMATPAHVDAVVAEGMKLLQNRGAQVLNAIDDGVFFLDPEGRAIFVNEAASRLLGFTNRELLGRSMHDATHHHYPDGSVFPVEECPILSSVTDAVQQRVGGDIFWRKDGTALPIDYTSIPIKEGRTVVGVVVTFRDISAEQRADEQEMRLQRERELRAEAEAAREALRASERQYQFLTEAIPVQVWTARPDGTLDYVTRRCADYFGKSCEEILGEGWQHVIHPDDLGHALDRWTHSLATGAPYEVEFRLRRADGAFRWHISRALAQTDDSGKIVRWFGSNMDIQERKD